LCPNAASRFQHIASCRINGAGVQDVGQCGCLIDQSHAFPCRVPMHVFLFHRGIAFCNTVSVHLSLRLSCRTRCALLCHAAQDHQHPWKSKKREPKEPSASACGLAALYDLWYVQRDAKSFIKLLCFLEWKRPDVVCQRRLG